MCGPDQRGHTHQIHVRHLRAVVAFDSTHEALECERTAKNKRYQAVSFNSVAIGGLWIGGAMPIEAREAFEKKRQGNFAPVGIYEPELISIPMP